MKKSIGNGPISPEEFQRQLADFMRQHFPGSRVEVKATDSGIESEEPAALGNEFAFGYKPRDIKAYLDRFVIKQEEAKKVLSVAMCDHYHHVRLAHQGQIQPNYTKQNIILVGPTGVGKTYLIRSVADLIGVPFIKADATKFSETGYVGGDVEDIVRELVRKADGDVAKAEFGIIYIDEIDKIATVTQHSGRDVSGRGVQTNLLKLMEETDVPARSPQDIAGQVQALFEMQQRGKKGPNTINTKHILFIVSGAFGGLEKIIQRRMRTGEIGFSGRKQPEAEHPLDHAQTRDFIDFGFEPEFIGRLPVRVICQPLSVDDLFSILKTSEGSIIRQYEQTFAAYGIEVLFRDDGLKEIAARAAEEQTGARGLMTVCERVFRDFKYELPSTKIKKFMVTAELIRNPIEELNKLLLQQKTEEHNVACQFVYEFGRRFQETHGLSLTFTEEAAASLVNEALNSNQSVRDLCALKFKDYQFGLKLIAQNTGRKEFTIDKTVAQGPDKALSEWVVESYRTSEKKSQ